MSKKDFSVALKYVEARPRSQRRKGTEARVSGISVVGSGASATDLSLLQANLISVTNNFTALKDLFDSMFEKDSDGNIHAKLSLWSSGGITAGGVGSGGSGGGGGGISYNRLDAWADYSADKAGYVLSALLGKDLDNRVSALANAGYITASYLTPYALRSEIPSLVGYATQSWVGENFLSKSGGTVSGTLSVSSILRFSDTDGTYKILLQRDSSGNILFGGGFSSNNMYIDANVLRIRATESIFSSKVTAPSITANSLTIGGVTITYDSANEALCINGNMYALGGITAGEVGSGGSGGGGGISYNRLDSWADYSAEKAGYVLSALLGKDLDNRVSALANAGYITASYLAPYALRSEIPSLVGYATQSWVGENYLSKNGGTMTGSLCVSMYGWNNQLVLNGVDSNAGIEFRYSNTYVAALSCAQSNPYWHMGENAYPILHSGNYTDYALPLSGGTIYGGIGALKIKRSGIGNSYIEYQNDTETLGYIGFRAKGAPAYMDDATYIQYDLLHLYNYRDYVVAINGNSTINGSITATSFIGNLTGNADSATKLQTPRTIWGKSFDGTGNIWGNLTNVGNIYSRGAQNGGYVICSSIRWDEALSIETTDNDGNWLAVGIIVKTNGNVAIGGATADEKLHVHGNGKFTGSVTAPSITANLLSIDGVIGISSGNDAKIILNNTDADDKYQYISFKQNGAEYGQLGTYGNDELRWVGNTILHSGNISSFNAGSATKLATPRTIWGRTFDGTSDIIGSLSIGYSQIYFGDNSSNFCIGWGVGNMFLYNNYYGHYFSTAGKERLRIAHNGNVLIDTTEDSGEKLQVNGNGKFEGSVTASSLTIGGTSNITGDIMFAGPNKIAWHNDKNNYYISSPTTSTSAYLEYNAYGGHSFLGGNVTIGGGPAYERLHVYGNGKFTGALLSQALRSAGISIGCDASGVASDNYTREINTFANKLYLQYRGGDLDLCGGGGTTYIGGALEGKTANFTSITANSLTIGGATITYDSANEALCINGNMYALGGITAGGAGISAYSSLETRVARLEQQLNIS